MFDNKTAADAYRWTKPSAMTSLLYLCLLGTTSFGALAIVFKGDAWLRIAAVVPVGYGLVMYGLFALFRPDLLLSEEHRVRAELLRMLQQQQGGVPVAPINLQAILNPSASGAPPGLPPPTGNE